MKWSSADLFDPVPRWKRLALENLRRWPPGKRGIRVRVSAGFVLLSLVATLTGAHPHPWLAALLFGTFLIQELPGALWAVALHRLVRVTVGISGGHTEVSGGPLPARKRLFISLAASATSLALGCALVVLGRFADAELIKEAGRLQLFWGAVQFLPLFPFKLGGLLAELGGPWVRVKQGIASLGVAFAVTLKCASHHVLPLVLVALGVWLYVCCHELLRGIAWARDARLATDERLTNIRALTLDNEPQKALHLARDLLHGAHSTELRARAAQALAWAAIGAGDATAAHAAIAELPEQAIDAHLVASYLAVDNRPREAIMLLESAHGLGASSSESLRLLADQYYRVDDRGALALLAASAQNLLGAEDLERIRKALASPLPKPPTSSIAAVSRTTGGYLGT